MVSILGVDPGFAHVGFAVVSLRGGDTRPTVLDMGCITTEKSDKRLKVLASDDNYQRAREIAKRLRLIALDYGIAALCTEAKSFPRNASVAAKTAMCWGILAALGVELDVPLVQASPQQIKKVVVGKKSATKEEVEAAVRKWFGLTKDQFTFPKVLREHPHDALASIQTCMDSEVVRALVRGS